MFVWIFKGKLNTGKAQKSTNDICMFIGDKVIVYVDDWLFFLPKIEFIKNVISNIKVQGLDLQVEDYFAVFLGVNIERSEDGAIALTQTGLIKRIICALNLDPKSSNDAIVPSETKTLGSNIKGDPTE